ncbi:hypothetical protein, partial [Escherichia coli]|uniref:hypothetical protein n=1 Tax=Escherichia coli TaxID=562 RepID=UPI0019D699DC
VTLVWGISPRQPSGKNIIRWLLKKRTNGSVRYCQYTSLILLWRMREGKHLCPGKTTLSDHAVLYLPVSTFVGTGFFIHPL